MRLASTLVEEDAGARDMRIEECPMRTSGTIPRASSPCFGGRELAWQATCGQEADSGRQQRCSVEDANLVPGYIRPGAQRRSACTSGEGVGGAGRRLDA